jgi:hypothetical protein
LPALLRTFFLAVTGLGKLALIAGLSLAASACSSGSNGGTTTVSVSGVVRYEYVPTNTACAGLNFGAVEIRPIRGATVQLLDAASGTEIARATSSSTGSYAIAGIPGDTMIQLRVRAELKDSNVPGWDVEIRDNFIAGASDYDDPPPPAFGSRALYALDGTAFDSGRNDVTRNLTAATGWDGAAYSGPRAAAPFAILDTAYASMQFVRALDPTANFAPLDMFWSVNNVPGGTRFDLTAGEIGTSGYISQIDSMVILGDASVDTDEFDSHVVSHEWAHYFEDVLARSNSEGGAHFLGESLDASLAFSEGFAEALGSMILNDPVNCDTLRPGTSGGGGFTVEGNNIYGAAGWFNEVSVATLIWDLWDSDDDGVDTGSIGFAPIYDTMVGPHAMSDSFATLFTFATELRTMLNAQDAALLDTLLAREQVVSGAALDIWATNETNDAGVGEDVFPMYVPYTADGSVTNICVNNQLDGFARHGNNVAENRYLRITIPADDEYDVSVVTTTPTNPTANPDDRDYSDPDIIIYRGSVPEEVARGETDIAEDMEPTFRTPVMYANETYVAFVEEWRFHDHAAASTFPQRICFDVSLTPTP